MWEEAFRVAIRESLGLVIAAGAIWMWRRDMKQNSAKLNETIDAYIQYGERAAEREVKLTVALERITVALEQIEARFEATMICPVSQVSTEALRRIRNGEVPARSISQRELVGAIREVLSDEAYPNA